MKISSVSKRSFTYVLRIFAWDGIALQSEKSGFLPSGVGRIFFAALQFAVKVGAGKGPPALGSGQGDAQGGCRFRRSALQREDSEPGAQTGRPDAAGPVRRLPGGCSSPA